MSNTLILSELPFGVTLLIVFSIYDVVFLIKFYKLNSAPLTSTISLIILFLFIII